MDIDTSPLPIAIYLRNERIGLRAPEREDAAQVAAWHEGAFPLTPEAAGALLVAQETIPWGNNPAIRLIAVELATGAVAGGAVLERTDNRVGKLRLTAGGAERPAAERQGIRAEMLRILLPWAMDEIDLMVVSVDIPADETVLIEAATEAGMRQAVRLREYVARPAGRVDLLMFERVNPAWGRGGANGDA
ncbi:MAG TPA: GNAT family protein [Thermomicrobiales bacterium]|nr:GNAT family protein [Thermomicrobiales bacterium]